MSLAGLLAITRPVNCLVAGLAALLGYIVATGTLVPFALILFPVVFAITAAGNVFNDLCDLEIDRINRPDRPLPSGKVSPRAAGALAAALFAAGLVLAGASALGLVAAAAAGRRRVV